MLFPVESGVKPGEATADLTVTSDAEEISAKVRKNFDVPKAPKVGEARPWFLSDHQVRFGESVVLAPSLDDEVTPDESISFIGYGCRKEKGGPAVYSGRLVPFSGGPEIALPIAWMSTGDSSGKPGRSAAESCGWLRGQVESPLPAGLWTFVAPKDLAKEHSPGTEIEFRVISTGPQPAILPAEVQSAAAPSR